MFEVRVDAVADTMVSRQPEGRHNEQILTHYTTNVNSICSFDFDAILGFDMTGERADIDTHAVVPITYSTRREQGENGHELSFSS